MGASGVGVWGCGGSRTEGQVRTAAPRFFASTCKTAAAGAVLGASTVLAAGAVSGAAVPWAMTTFGKVVPGLGTIHTAASAGGIAAKLQLLNVGLLTSSAMKTGATVGACVHTTKPIRTARSVLRSTTSVIERTRRRLFK